jgi:hypothetical protein
MRIKLAVSICLMIILLHESDSVDAQTHSTRAVLADPREPSNCEGINRHESQLHIDVPRSKQPSQILQLIAQRLHRFHPVWSGDPG